MKKEKEYQRISKEILQDQQIRITLFTFSITTVAAIIGFSSQIVPTVDGTSNITMSIIVFAIYAVLIPCIILVNHYSRGINCKSEYLRIFHDELWMVSFDQLTEEIIPSSPELTSSHRVLVTVDGFSSENAFRIAYFLLSILITAFAFSKTDIRNLGFLLIYLTFFIISILVARFFRPISKREYRQLWKKTLEDHRLN